MDFTAKSQGFLSQPIKYDELYEQNRAFGVCATGNFCVLMSIEATEVVQVDGVYALCFTCDEYKVLRTVNGKEGKYLFIICCYTRLEKPLHCNYNILTQLYTVAIIGASYIIIM